MAGKRTDRISREAVVQLGARLNQFKYFRDNKPGASESEKAQWLRDEIVRLRREAGLPVTLFDSENPNG
jgi:hypothetical protein